ncbi:hypothetical protein, partial [uncultured Helicobacter sp.]|uniref:hypothetical protein n=1 Tax=uncultured Helicobacter sp. TaxID=175537 RepID=UPI00260E0DA8
NILSLPIFGYITLTSLIFFMIKGLVPEEVMGLELLGCSLITLLEYLSLALHLYKVLLLILKVLCCIQSVFVIEA